MKSVLRVEKQKSIESISGRGGFMADKEVVVGKTVDGRLLVFFEQSGTSSYSSGGFDITIGSLKEIETVVYIGNNYGYRAEAAEAQERISNNMIFDVYDKERASGESANGLAGVVNSLDLTYKKTYPATGEEIIGQEVVGEVIIINNYTKNQPLVATTRLLSPDGKLYRLKETVNVPAGGTVKAAVYADEPKEEMAIGPACRIKFTPKARKNLFTKRK